MLSEKLGNTIDIIEIMIKTKEDLKFYLAADKFALGKKYNQPKINDDVWKFQILLRKLEYYKNSKRGLLNNLFLAFFKFRKHKLGLKLGLDIPANVFGAGLRINHFGNIVINGRVRVGLWCDIHQGVNIGTNSSIDGKPLIPKIGKNVWIGPGAKLFGNIEIGSNTAIGANAVVTKSFSNNKTIAGIPAKIIKDSGTEKLNVSANFERMISFFSENPEFNKYKP